MGKKVFVSFDFENDRHYKYLLTALSANPQFDLSFEDASSGEIDSNNVGRIKAALTHKINNADYTLVIVGEYANQRHRHSSLIGYKNWINFEVAQSKAAGNRIVAVKIERGHESPDELLGANASWAYSFSEAAITTALNDA